jgi:hypothetical protein
LCRWEIEGGYQRGGTLATWKSGLHVLSTLGIVVLCSDFVGHPSPTCDTDITTNTLHMAIAAAKPESAIIRKILNSYPTAHPAIQPKVSIQFPILYSRLIMICPPPINDISPKTSGRSKQHAPSGGLTLKETAFIHPGS